ncbi:hypothetical protein ACMFMG_000688, partial [Clarireedia jacksonii]
SNQTYLDSFPQFLKQLSTSSVSLDFSQAQALSYKASNRVLIYDLASQLVSNRTYPSSHTAIRKYLLQLVSWEFIRLRTRL